MSEIILRDICKSYENGFHAVNEFNLEIEKGEFIVFVGPSGCGKSTTLFMLAGLNDPTSGHIYFGGKDVTKVAPEDREIGLVFQNYALYPHMTVADNIMFPLINRKVPKAEARERAQEMAKLVQLDHLMDRKPKALSGGQQQRVAIARALAIHPDVLLMDEPTSALDPISTSKIEELALKLKKDYTIIMVTHNMQQAARISDKTAFFLLGEVVEYNDTETLFSVPKDKRTEDYITGRFG